MISVEWRSLPLGGCWGGQFTPRVGARLVVSELRRTEIRSGDTVGVVFEPENGSERFAGCHAGG
jgi:hypothetical protein